MTINQKWILALAILALVFVVQWEHARENAARTQGAAKVQEQVVATAEQQIAQTDAADTTYRQQVQQQAAALTPQTALAELQARLPAAEIATEQAFTSAELPEETREKLPASPGYLCLSDAQTKAIATEQLSCDADRHSLAARESDLTDLHIELAARTAEAQAWERTAKGGSKWQRFGRVLKYTGCAAAGAGAGALLSRQGPTAAAIGGAAGVVGCSLF